MAFLQGLQGGPVNGGKTGNGCHQNGNVAEGIADVENLYILGDFFDFWFSAGAFVYPEFRDIVELFLDLKERGIKIHFCEGNHDFFLADFFSRQLGMEVISDWATLNLDGRRVLISHGDTVDNRNRRYLMLRKLLRSTFFYKLQRALPVSFLWDVARRSSHLSKELTAETADALARKMRIFAQKKFRDGFDAVILGHSHQYLREESIVNGSRKTFVLLGDWVKQNSYLCYEDGNFTLASYRPSGRRV